MPRFCWVTWQRCDAYQAFLNHPIEHDDGFGLLFPDHEPEVATRVPEGTLQTSTAKNMLAAPIRDKQSEMCIFKVAVKNGAQQGSVLVPPLMSTVVSRTDANGAPIGTKWLHLCRSMPTTCLSQYVTSLRFLHHHQAGVDVVVVGVLQLHSTVIDCGRRGERVTAGSFECGEKGED